MTAATGNMQGILDAAWAHLLPTMTGSTVDPSPVAAELTDRLSGLRLAPLQAHHAPESSAEAWTKRAFRPAGGLCEAQRTITSVRLGRDGARWRLTLVEDDEALSATVGTADWLTNLAETDHGGTGVPLAVSGGWLDPDTFAAEVIFLETPHRLTLTCSLGAATFQADWVTVPLRAGRLSDLRMPR